jgi:hypothetical protein
MRDPSPSEPFTHLLDELLEDGAGDPVADARVRAVLRTIHEQVPEPPDEVTQRRHLARAARVRRQVAARHQAARLARTAAVAGILVFALAAAGVLPDGLQRTVASAGTVVGVSLPSPSPATPAGEDGDPLIREIGDERPPRTDDGGDGEESAGPPTSSDQRATGAEAAAHADERRLPPAAHREAADRAAQALTEAGPAQQADDRAHEAVAAGPANANARGDGAQGRPETGPARGHGHDAGESEERATARASSTSDRGGPPGRGGPQANQGPSGQRGPGTGNGPSGNGPPSHAPAAARG